MDDVLLPRVNLGLAANEGQTDMRYLAMYVNLSEYDSGCWAYLSETLGCIQISSDRIKSFGNDPESPRTDITFLVDDVLHPVPFAQNHERGLYPWLTETKSSKTRHGLLNVIIVHNQGVMKRTLMLSAFWDVDGETDGASSDGDGLVEGQDPRVSDDDISAEFRRTHHGVMLG